MDWMERWAIANNKYRFKAIVGLVKEYIADTKDVMSTLLSKI